MVTHDPTIAATAGRLIRMRDGVIASDTAAATTTSDGMAR
jgi:ABC-type lipoprotein export system ATPase subunit